ncbi:unnamed protein product [Soboliphyme baturini]|uniref:GlutR_N domain-containing protein n=1 Tax=Soboliphyme baturini TaxID=241478 RepID=A0A183J742_9BILA|nr:unnamed protein product [Soboliphyme baturini]
MQTYALISTCTRFELVNIINGKRKMLLATNCNKSVRGNIADVYGISQLNSLREFVQVAPDGDTLREFGVSSSDVKSAFRLRSQVRWFELRMAWKQVAVYSRAICRGTQGGIQSSGESES